MEASSRFCRRSNSSGVSSMGPVQHEGARAGRVARSWVRWRTGSSSPAGSPSGASTTGRSAPWPRSPPGAVREYVGYEEWTGDGFLRREVARCGVALILAFGDDMDVHDGEVGPDPQRLRAFVVGNQSYRERDRGARTPARRPGRADGGRGAGAPRRRRGLQRHASSPSTRHSDATVHPAGGAAGRRAVVGSPARRPRRIVRRAASVPTLCSRSGVAPPQLVASRGQARVEPLMDETGWSRRHVTERFRRQLGITPKAYARLLRFQHATALLMEPEPPPLARRRGHVRPATTTSPT